MGSIQETSRRPAARQRGAVLIWTALLLLILIAMLGLALDVGFLIWNGQKLQNAADAAALAGAAKVRADQEAARDAAVEFAFANEAVGEGVVVDRNDSDDPDTEAVELNDAAGEVVIGRFDRDPDEDEESFDPEHTSPNAVYVRAARTTDAHGAVPLFFGHILGTDTANASREAIAMIGGGTGAGIIALNETKKQSFYLHGDCTLEVNDAAIQVNSSASGSGQNAGSVIQGNAVLQAEEINVYGANNFIGSSYTFEGDENEGEPRIPDPLAGLADPSKVDIGASAITGDPSEGVVDSDGFVHYEPGWYPGGIHLTGGVDVFLEPGIYYLGDEAGAGGAVGGWDITSGAILKGFGVMFFIASGNVELNGNAQVLLTAPGPEGGDYEGISFFQARWNTEKAVLNGTGSVDEGNAFEAGCLYFPESKIEVGGTNDITLNQLIADQIEVYGTGTKTINYNGDVPAAGLRVFLVR